MTRETELLAWFTSQHDLTLAHHSPSDRDDRDIRVIWRVSKASGPLNNGKREDIGRGTTAADAIASARANLSGGYAVRLFPADGFTAPQWDGAADALADAMEVEDVCATDLVRIVVEALGLPPLSPEARLQHMMDARS